MCELGCGEDVEEAFEGPMATNSNPQVRARITIMPCESWIVIVLRSFSAAVVVLERVESDPRILLDVRGREEDMREDALGW